MDTTEDRLELLLLDAEERRPVFEEGLPGEAAQSGPKPRKGIRGDDSPDWRRTDADPEVVGRSERSLVEIPEGRDRVPHPWSTRRLEVPAVGAEHGCLGGRTVHETARSCAPSGCEG